jgi:N-acetylmuramoyl-L-alanine amidase CwlA
MYPIVKKLIKFNNPETPIQVKGIVVHETANPGDSDEMEQAYFNGGDRQASAHAFIDQDSITQCIEWDNKAWHAGPIANGNYIGIELCHTSDAAKFAEIWKRGTWLFAFLLTKHNILKVTADTVMSHAEVSNRWHETDHQDPVSYFASFGKTVDMFRSDVQTEVNKVIQSALNANDYNLVVDGALGPKSVTAIKSFQSKCALTADGVVGPLTWKKLSA